MQVSDVMAEQVVTVSPDASLREAIEVMLHHQVGSAVVVDGGLAGIITRSDVLRASYYEGDALAELPVRAGMSSDVVTVRPDASIGKALTTMKTHDIKKLPVVEDLNLVGIVTTSDVARHQPERVREVREQIQRRDEWTGE